MEAAGIEPVNEAIENPKRLLNWGEQAQDVGAPQQPSRLKDLATDWAAPLAPRSSSTPSKQDALLPAIALILLGFVIPPRPTPCPRVPPLSPLAGHTGGTCATPPRLHPAPRRAVCDWRGPPVNVQLAPQPARASPAAPLEPSTSPSCGCRVPLPSTQPRAPEAAPLEPPSAVQVRASPFHRPGTWGVQPSALLPAHARG